MCFMFPQYPPPHFRCVSYVSLVPVGHHAAVVRAPRRIKRPHHHQRQRDVVGAHLDADVGRGRLRCQQSELSLWVAELVRIVARSVSHLCVLWVLYIKILMFSREFQRKACVEFY